MDLAWLGDRRVVRHEALTFLYYIDRINRLEDGMRDSRS
jgi:hypothetical protein